MPLHCVELLLPGNNVGQIYLLEPQIFVKRLQTLAGTNTHDVAFVLNLRDKDSRLPLKVLQFLNCKAEVDAPCVNAVLFKFERLPAGLSISHGFGLDGHLGSSIDRLLVDVDAVNAFALFKLLNAGTCLAKLLQT